MASGMSLSPRPYRCIASRRQNQKVIADRAGTRLQPARREIHASHIDQAEVEVLLAPQNRAHRFRDLLGLEARGRDLIEQWLEQVVVVTVEQHDLYGGATQRPGGSQTAEPRAYDDDYFVSLRQDRKSTRLNSSHE